MPAPRSKPGMSPTTIAMLAILAGVLMWTWWLDAQQKTRRAARAVPAVVTTLPTVARIAEPQRMASDTGWGRDPFERRVQETGDREPAVAPPAPAPAAGPPAAATLAVRLDGIMEGPRGRIALINGEGYRAGGRVGSWEVVQIERDRVVLRFGGTLKTLTLSEDR
jgi:Type II secretion system protein C